MRLRSLLFVPGDRPDQMVKALAADADALILDLEDAVAPERKPAAREHVAEFLRRMVRRTPVFVRINPPTCAWSEQDLVAIAGAKPDGIVLPKAQGAASILELQRLLPNDGTRILPIATETPAAVFRLGEYASIADRLIGLTWGVEDLSAAVGATSARTVHGGYTPPFEMLRGLALFAAHAAGVAAIDTIYPAFRDLSGLAAYAARAAHDGFSGMLAIHPAQVPVINAAFSPTPEAIARAERIVAAFRAHPGAGVVSLDGIMLDAPHLRQAERLIAWAADTQV
jgi:citrate lyase subunit beta/citryl-CoA lyase